MFTGYVSDALEAEAGRFQVYRYLAKPLDVNLFCQVVQEALGDIPSSRTGILILSDERYRQVIHLLERLRTDVDARCTLLTDADGRVMAQSGNMDELSMEQIASLLSGGIATLMEVGRVLDGDADTINLVYREGNCECLYALNVGQRLLLIIVIERGPYSSRLGTVWYYAQQAAITLSQALDEAEYANPQEVFGEEVEQAFGTELGRLFELD